MASITFEPAPPAPSPVPARTSLFAKLTNVLAYPGDVFAEVASAPPRLRNVFIPTLLVGVAGVLATGAIGGDDPAGAAVAATGTEAAKLVIAARLRLLAALVPVLAVFIGTGWSALVLWGIGRVFLKVRFSYWKAMEVVALTGGIVLLGTVFAASPPSRNPPSGSSVTGCS
jgi:hypothetical protein